MSGWDGGRVEVLVVISTDITEQRAAKLHGDYIKQFPQLVLL